MSSLARADFDVFTMDITGYGFSSRPLMDDPRNLSESDQAALMPSTQPSPHPFNLVTSDSETDDINRIVEFICELRGVERVNLIGCRAVAFAPVPIRYVIQTKSNGW